MATNRSKEPSDGSDEGSMPSREDILKFVAESQGRVGKREIARAFGVKGGDRIVLKQLLADLADEGLLRKKGKELRQPGTLPRVLVIQVTGRDADGELVGEPANWDRDEDGDPPPIVVATDGRRGIAPGIGDRVLARLKGETTLVDGPLVATPIKVIDRRPVETLAVVRLGRLVARLLPVDRKQREIEIPRADAEAKAADGDLVRVAIRRVGRYGQTAQIIESLGPAGGEDAVSMIAIHAHGIPHVFPDAVLKEAEGVAPPALTGREDWRHLPFITIDPPDARDHDDAVHAEPDPDPANPGGHVVTVAIADVSQAVAAGSALDREARHRGNSVYLPDRVIPMLPERISNELCSLRAHEEHAAIAVRMVFHADGRKHRHSFHRVMIRIAAGLHYAQAQAAADGAPDAVPADVLERAVKPLWAAYEVLRRGREARAPLELDVPERRVVLDAQGRIDRVIVPERLTSHKLIEEFMIQANVAAAETCERAGVPVIYRVHDSPSQEKMETLREFLSTLDIRLPKGGNLRPRQFNGVLAKVEESDHKTLVNEVVLRSQAQAAYDPVNIGHFGLNLHRYAHFTSPIRRYADLVVHRAVIRAAKLGPDGLGAVDEDELAKTAAHISATERRAMAAERETVDRLVAMWLADQVGARFTGRITGVTRAGLFVTLADTGADGLVPISTLGAEFYRHHEDTQALVGEETGETFRLGETVEVRLVEAAPLQGALRFEIVRHAGPTAEARPGRRSGTGRGTATRARTDRRPVRAASKTTRRKR